MPGFDRADGQRLEGGRHQRRSKTLADHIGDQDDDFVPLVARNHLIEVSGHAATRNRASAKLEAVEGVAEVSAAA